MATAQEITSEIARLTERLRIARNGLKDLNPNYQSNQAILARYRDEVATIPGQILSLEQQLQAIQAPASAGAIVDNASRARDDAANATRPPPGQEILTTNGRIQPVDETSSSGTNADTTPTTASNPTVGTNAATRPISQTQAPLTQAQLATLQRAPGSGSGLVSGAGNQSPQAPLGNIGTGSGNEDSGQVKNNTQTQIDTLFSQVEFITPEGNVLDQYASYTYNISVYLMDKIGYQRLIRKKQKDVSGYALLFQSGGAGQNSPDGYGIMARNPFFSLDYYIDNLEIYSLVSGKGTGAPHNSNRLKFTVIEPNGITLVNNLNDAVLSYIYNGDVEAKLKGRQQGKDYQSGWGGQNYLMVIRFYGYDSNGNLVRGGVQKPNSGADPNAVVEKYIPFQITALKFRVGSKAVEYTIEALAPGNNVNASSNRGTIPYDLEIAASTLKEALAGELATTGVGEDDNGRPPASATATQASVRAIDNATIPITSGTSSNGVGVLTQEQLAAAQAAPGSGSTYTPPANPNSQPAPGKANTAPKKTLTVTKGLFAALNKFQQDQVKDGLQSLPDIYEIEFASPALADAKVTYNGGANLSNSAMPKGGSAADQLDPKKQSANSGSNTLRAKAGMQIVQFLDQIARNSTYIQDQQTVVINPVTGKEKTQGKAGENLAWFLIGFTAEPGDWDRIRNDYAYRIKYVLQPYWVATVDSAYFPRTVFRGVHKSYPYWFTGQNTAVISYEQNYDTLYTRILSGGPTRDLRTTDLGELEALVKRKFSPRSGQSSQGAEGRTNEPAANAADKLYSPGDLANSEIKIIGDPAWLFQGEACWGASANRWNPAPFFADGTINSEARQIYYEINFNLPGDYNLNTGLMEKGKTGTGRG